MLTHLGHESVDFTDPVDALNWFEREHESVDLVLLDWVMPRMTGNAALEQLLAIDPKVRVAVATGHLMQEEAMAALAEKGISLVRKPFSISKLASVVSDVR
jgi:DNA-binding NtrC family response regulator